MSPLIKVLGVRIFGIFLLYLSNVLIANLLGATNFGYYASAMSLALIVAVIADLGMSIFLTKKLAIVKHNTNSVSRILADTLALSTVSTIMVLLVLLLTLTLLWVGGVQVKTLRILHLATLIFPLLVFVLIRQGASIPLAGTANALAPEQLIIPGVIILFSLLNLYILQYQIGLYDVFFVVMLATFLALMQGFISIRRYYSLSSIFIRRLKIRSLIIYSKRGLPFLISKFSFTVHTQIMVVVISFAFSPKDAGIFFISNRISNLIAVPLSLIYLTIQPQLSLLYHKEKRTRLINVTRSAASLSLYSVVIGFILGIIFGKFLLLLFGDEFVLAEKYLFILMIGEVVNALAGPNATVMQMVGLQVVHSQIMVTFSVTKTLVLVAVSLSGSITAFVIATVIMNGILNAILTYTVYSRRDFLVTPYLSLSWLRSEKFLG